MSKVYGHLNVIPVYVSSSLPDTKPAREHVERSWMRRRVYHKRIQKKWLKRFGTVANPQIFYTAVPLGPAFIVNGAALALLLTMH